MTKRNPILVVALTFVTFTVYAYYWLYKTTDELKDESGRDDLSPVLDVVLAVLTLGLWGLWAAYRNARITHELFEELGEKHTDRSVAVALFGAASFFSGWAWLISMALLQDDYNRLAEDPADVVVPTRRARRYEAKRPVDARVDVEPTGSGDSHPSEASSPPVFVSKAPAPIVF